MKAIFLFSFSCYLFFSSQHSLFAAISEDQKDEIRKTVFEYLFKNNESILQNKAAAYCLSIEGERDPSSKLLKKLRKVSPLVKKWSDCELVPSVDGGKVDVVGYVVDRKTKKKAISFEIYEIKWNEPNDVIVIGGYSEYSLSSSTHRYTVRKEGPKWKVVEDTLDSIAKGPPGKIFVVPAQL